MCGDCRTARFIAEIVARNKARREQVEALWAEGKTAREIAAVMGWETKNPGTVISVLRNQCGYDLPHRRTPEQIARITADNGENLRKAREAFKRQAAA